MQDKELIRNLIQDHKKIATAESLSQRFLKWTLIAILCVSIGIASLGLKEEWEYLFTTPSFLLQNVFILFSSFIAGLFALKLSQPGQLNNNKGRFFIIIASCIWSLILLGIGLNHGFNWDEIQSIGWGCMKDILVVGTLPGVSLFLLVRQGAVLNRSLTSILIFIASLGFGAWATQFTCHNDDPVHILLWHFFPISVFSLLGIQVGKKWLRKI